MVGDVYATDVETTLSSSSSWALPECEVCTEVYSNEVCLETECPRIPRILSCGHTFCQICLDDWRRSRNMREIVCPTCRHVTSMTMSCSINQLPRNYELMRICDEARAQHHKIIEHHESLYKELYQREQITLEARQQAEALANQLMHQVELNQKERSKACKLADLAYQQAENATEQSNALQVETKALRRQIKQFSTRLSLHTGEQHDPACSIVLVCDPITIGSWPLCFTRYSVITLISMDTLNRKRREEILEEWEKKKNTATSACSTSYSMKKVHRRYSDFVYLHEQLCRDFSGCLVPIMPEKYLRNMEKEFVEERCLSLQAFLRSLLEHKIIGKSYHLFKFLSCSTEDYNELENFSLQSEDEEDYSICSSTSLVSSSNIVFSALSSVSNIFSLNKKKKKEIVVTNMKENGNKSIEKLELSTEEQNHLNLCIESCMNDLQKNSCLFDEYKCKYEYSQETCQKLHVVKRNLSFCLKERKDLWKVLEEMADHEQICEEFKNSSNGCCLAHFLFRLCRKLQTTDTISFYPFSLTDRNLEEHFACQLYQFGGIQAAKERMEKEIYQMHDIHSLLQTEETEKRKQKFLSIHEKILSNKQQVLNEINGLEPSRTLKTLDILLSVAKKKKEEAHEKKKFWRRLYQELV